MEGKQKKTHFFPMQLRGPVLKACMASNSSVLYLGSPNQRSGRNSIGSVQYLSQWLMAHWKTETTV